MTAEAMKGKILKHIEDAAAAYEAAWIWYANASNDDKETRDALYADYGEALAPYNALVYLANDCDISEEAIAEAQARGKEKARKQIRKDYPDVEID